MGTKVLMWIMHDGDGDRHMLAVAPWGREHLAIRWDFSEPPGWVFATTHRTVGEADKVVLLWTGSMERAGFAVLRAPFPLNVPFPGGFGATAFEEWWNQVVHPNLVMVMMTRGVVPV